MGYQRRLPLPGDDAHLVDVEARGHRVVIASSPVWPLVRLDSIRSAASGPAVTGMLTVAQLCHEPVLGHVTVRVDVPSFTVVRTATPQPLA
jgi:hypothetical protein